MTKNCTNSATSTREGVVFMQDVRFWRNIHLKGVSTGAQAEDSTLLQFILDWKKDHAQSRNVDDEAVYNDNDGPEEGLNIAALAERSPPLHEPNEMHLFKSGSDWVGVLKIVATSLCLAPD